jgi:hypothetical protein
VSTARQACGRPCAHCGECHICAGTGQHLHRLLHVTGAYVLMCMCVFVCVCVCMRRHVGFGIGCAAAHVRHAADGSAPHACECARECARECALPCACAVTRASVCVCARVRVRACGFMCECEARSRRRSRVRIARRTNPRIVHPRGALPSVCGFSHCCPRERRTIPLPIHPPTR